MKYATMVLIFLLVASMFVLFWGELVKHEDIADIILAVDGGLIFGYVLGRAHAEES